MTSPAGALLGRHAACLGEGHASSHQLDQLKHCQDPAQNLPTGVWPSPLAAAPVAVVPVAVVPTPAASVGRVRS